MKISEEYIEYESPTIKVSSAEYEGNFKIRIIFSDKSEKTVDFKSFLEKSNHPSIKKYLKEDAFKKFSIVNGNLNWNDYELIFPLADLYKGKITI